MIDIAGFESEKEVDSSATLAAEEVDNAMHLIDSTDPCHDDKREAFIAKNNFSEPSHAIIVDFLIENVLLMMTMFTSVQLLKRSWKCTRLMNRVKG